MSLLNNMLKNLEKRNQEQVQKSTDQPVLSELQAPPAKKRSWAFTIKLLEICLIIFLSITVVYLSIQLFDSLKKRHLLNFIVTPASQAKSANLTVKSPKSKATLQNIFITRGASEIVIQFTFDMVVRYQLSENNEHSQSIITLSNVNFNANLPLLPVDFIRALTTKTIGNDLQITMETAPGTEIKVMQDQTQKPVRLIFILTNNPAPVVLTQPEMKKTPVLPTPEEQATADYQEALDLVAHDKLSQAITLLMKVVQVEPGLVAARKTLVTLLIKSSQIDTAASYVETGLKITPDAIDLIELDARLLLLKNRPEEALRILQTISPLIMQEPEYYALLASVQQRLGQVALAEQIYKQLLTLDHGNANWWVGMGLALESQKKNNTALQAYQQALSLGGLSSRLQINVQEKIAKLGK